MEDFAALDKGEQRSRILWELGVLLAPFEEIQAAATSPELSQYRKAIAKVQAGRGLFTTQRIEPFTTQGEISHESLRTQLVHLIYPDISLNTIVQQVTTPTITPIDLHQLHTEFKATYQEIKRKIAAVITMVEVDWDSPIYAANTPFTVYNRVRDVIAGVKDRLEYHDRYLRDDFFYLYLRHVDSEVKIRLVTTEGRNTPRDAFGIKGIIHVSNLFRQEFSHYQLVEVTASDIHDRFLRVDDNIFNLGPGVTAAGKSPTIFANVNNSAQEHQILDDVISKAVATY